MKTFAVFAYVVLALIGITACAMTLEQRLDQAAGVSKQTAELLYKAIYVAHLENIVSATDMEKADEAYEVWSYAQTEFVLASSKGQYDENLAQTVQAALEQMLEIVVRHQL